MPNPTLADEPPQPHLALSLVGGLPNIYGAAADIFVQPDLSLRVELGTGILPPALGIGLHHTPARLTRISPDRGEVGVGVGLDVFTFLPRPHELLIPVSAEFYARRWVGPHLAVHGGITAGAGLAVGGLGEEAGTRHIEPGLLFRLFLGVTL